MALGIIIAPRFFVETRRGMGHIPAMKKLRKPRLGAARSAAALVENRK